MANTFLKRPGIFFCVLWILPVGFFSFLAMSGNPLSYDDRQRLLMLEKLENKQDRPTKLEMILELERQGKLTDHDQELLNRARRRGMAPDALPAAPAASEEIRALKDKESRLRRENMRETLFNGAVALFGGWVLIYGFFWLFSWVIFPHPAQQKSGTYKLLEDSS